MTQEQFDQIMMFSEKEETTKPATLPSLHKKNEAKVVTL